MSLLPPSYVLPARALALIKEYSKPLTRPDWRTLQRMTFDNFYHSLRLTRSQTKMCYSPDFTNKQRIKITKLIIFFDKISRNAVNGHSKSDIYRDCFILSQEEVCIKYDIDIKTLNVITWYRY